MNILVVEDQTEMRQLIVDMLTEETHTVFQAENGLQAIELLMRYSIDCIVTDIIMSDMRGVELIQRLRQTNIPIVAVSGLSRQTFIEELFSSLGIVGFLQKPFLRNDLMQLIAVGSKK
ncbi:MAG: response regulator [Chitinivibrionales bacterium]|nr:response regulator [Chitinivibrionales bacterium]